MKIFDIHIFSKKTFLKDIIIKPFLVITDSPIQDYLGNIVASGAKVMYLGHGIGPKKGGVSPKFSKRIYRILYPLMSYDLFVCPNTLYIEKMYKKTFYLQQAKIIISNYPRNMIFLDKKFYEYCINQGNSFERKIYKFLLSKKKEGYKLIFILPTWRKDIKQYEKVVKDLIDVIKNVNRIYGKILFILKLHPHPYTRFIINKIKNLKGGNVIVLPFRFKLYQILPLADLIITDYSSVSSDALLGNILTIFYVPDLSDFEKELHGLHQFPGIIEKNKTRVVNLIQQLLYETKVYQQYLNKIKFLTNILFEDKRCDSILKVIVEFIKEKLQNKR